MRNSLSLVFGMFIILMITRCTESPKPVEKRRLVYTNPTTYTFKMPIKQLRDTIVQLFGIAPQLDDKTLMKIFYYKWPETGDAHIMQAMLEPETSDKAAFGTEYFKKPGTNNNIFLTQMGDYWYSTIYFDNNKPFKFTSSYTIEFKQLSNNSTAITVNAFHPQIINGTKCCGPHGNYSIYQNVQPTTVEEYTIILYIAQKLNIHGLNSLQLPK